MRSRIWIDSTADVRPAPWRQSAGIPVRTTVVEPPPPAEAGGESARLRTQISELNSTREQDLRQAYESGVRTAEAASRQQAQEQVRIVVEKLTDAVTRISSLRNETIARAEADTMRLAIEIARRILHREVAVDPSSLHALIKAALDKLQSQEIYRVRIHPELDGVLRACLREAGRTQAIEVVSDPTLPQGGAIFEISRGALDASVETQLREIERGLTDRLEART